LYLRQHQTPKLIIEVSTAKGGGRRVWLPLERHDACRSEEACNQGGTKWGTKKVL